MGFQILLLVLLLMVAAAGVLALVVGVRRLIRYVLLERRGWQRTKRPDIRVTIGLNNPPFGLGLNREVTDQVLGVSRVGRPIQAFRYGSDFWSARYHVMCVPFAHSMPPFYLFTPQAPIPMVNGLSLSTATHTMFFLDEDYGRKMAAILEPFLPTLGTQQLTIDHNLLVLFNIKSDAKSLKDAADLLTDIQEAIQASPVADYMDDFAPMFPSFIDHPDWHYMDYENSLLRQLPLQQEGYSHEVVNVVRATGPTPISFVRATHTWKTRESRFSATNHLEHTCVFYLNFTFVPLSVNMGQEGLEQKVGSPEFNKRFVVRCSKTRFAGEVFHQRQRDHLSRACPEGGFIILPDGSIEFPGGSEWPLEQIETTLAFFEEFFRLVPDSVWKDLEVWPPPIPQGPDQP